MREREREREREIEEGKGDYKYFREEKLSKNKGLEKRNEERNKVRGKRGRKIECQNEERKSNIEN